MISPEQAQATDPNGRLWTQHGPQAVELGWRLLYQPNLGAPVPGSTVTWVRDDGRRVELEVVSPEEWSMVYHHLRERDADGMEWWPHAQPTRPEQAWQECQRGDDMIHVIAEVGAPAAEVIEIAASAIDAVLHPDWAGVAASVMAAPRQELIGLAARYELAVERRHGDRRASGLACAALARARMRSSASDACVAAGWAAKIDPAEMARVVRARVPYARLRAWLEVRP